MSIINIEEARREGAKIVLGLAGTSGGGKTYTALQIGYGLAKRNGKKLGFLDTENRRGRLYADILPERFLIGDLTPPFSPQRYIDAIRAFEQAGVEVLIIDSATHEWEGTGGCEEIATDGNPKVPRWNKAKAEHKKFMNVLLQSSMHVIVCLRAREKVKMSKDADGKTLIDPLGIQPIQEKNFMFELTASLMMKNMGYEQDVLKCPEALRASLGKGKGYLGITEGESLRAWIDGASPIDKEVARWRAILLNSCEKGTAELKRVWETVPKELRTALNPDKETLKAAASGYDQQHAIAKSDGGPEGASSINAALNQPVKEKENANAEKPTGNPTPTVASQNGSAPANAESRPAPVAAAGTAADDEI